MKMKWYFLTFTVIAFVLGMMNTGRSAEVLFKDYDAVIVENLKCPDRFSGSRVFRFADG